jgi:hypothetical protein
VTTDPVDRLRQAGLAAIERCAAKEDEGIDPDTFAELGESPFWLMASPRRLEGTRRRSYSKALDGRAIGSRMACYSQHPWSGTTGRIPIGGSWAGASWVPGRGTSG